MELTPASDTWVDTARLEAKIIDVEGNYASTLDNLARNEGSRSSNWIRKLTFGILGKQHGQEETLLKQQKGEIKDYQGWMRSRTGGGRR